MIKYSVEYIHILRPNRDKMVSYLIFSITANEAEV